MRRRDFLQRLCAGIASIAVSGGIGTIKAKTATTKRPNILFLMSDDHAYNAISCYNSVLSKTLPTPNIDRIANEGIRLDNCMVTNSICSPSRAAIMTGKYSHFNKQYINYIKFDSSQQNVAKLLQKSGYNTAMIGKWHLRGEPTGFDYWNILPGQGRYIDPEFMEMELKPKKREGYVTNITTDIAMDWIENKWDDSKPFFMMCHHKAPHERWVMDPADEQMFEDIEVPEPPTLYDDHSGHAEITRHRGLNLYPTLARRMSEWPKDRAFEKSGIKDRKEGIAKSYQHYLKHYLGTIYSIDKNVGRILDFLEKKGILDDTLVIYTSDNGMFLGEHGWYDKRFMYEESLKIPFIARYPKDIKSRTVSDAICLNIDFPETFLDYAGVSIPSDMQGASLRPILRGKEPEDWRESMFYAYYEQISQYGVRTKRYKLVCYTGVRTKGTKIESYGSPQYEMFDLAKDPLELDSVYDDPAYADVRKRLKNEIPKLRKQYNVQDKDLPGNWEKHNRDIIEKGSKKKQI